MFRFFGALVFLTGLLLGGCGVYEATMLSPFRYGIAFLPWALLGIVGAFVMALGWSLPGILARAAAEYAEREREFARKRREHAEFAAQVDARIEAGARRTSGKIV